MLPTDCLRTSSAPCTTTASQENEYEIHNRHPFAHDIDCHNRCGCAGWNRAWSSELANHRHATADTCADDCFAGRASVEAFPAQVGISFNDEIAPTGVGKGYAAFRSVSEAHVSRGRDESDRSWLETRPLIQMQRHPYSDRRSGTYTRPCKRSLGDANPCCRRERAVRLRHRADAAKKARITALRFAFEHEQRRRRRRIEATVSVRNSSFRERHALADRNDLAFGAYRACRGG